MWREMVFKLADGVLRNNTFSAGVADSRSVREIDSLLKAADDCVLRAKHLGRNQVVILDGAAPVIALQPAPRTRPR
jgi:PleD family two-component response regulator